MRIYIRHAQKAYRNGKPFPNSGEEFKRYYAHDPPLTQEGRKEAEKVAEKLLRLYPVPTHIITSPYLRARETAAIMAGVIVKRNSPATIEILCQSDISEYLGNHCNQAIDVNPSTAKHKPPHPESYYSFRDRIQEHYQGWEKAETVTWIITHGIVINEIIRPWYGRRKIPYLGYITCSSPQEPPTLNFMLSS